MVRILLQHVIKVDMSDSRFSGEKFRSESIHARVADHNDSTTPRKVVLNPSEGVSSHRGEDNVKSNVVRVPI